MASLDLGTAKTVFPPDVFARAVKAVDHHPEPQFLAQLFSDVALLVQTPAQPDSLAPSSKKRKLDTETPQTNGTSASQTITKLTTTFECKDVSFAVPARKKLKLQFITDVQGARKQEIRLQNEKTNETEYILQASHIDQAFCLPVPEKQQRQWNFVIFPKPGATSADDTPCEQVVFTMNETPSTAATTVHGKPENDTYVTVTEQELNRLLQPHGKQVVIPNADEFASSLPQSHRRGEKAYHVKAHKGSKEGYLFFLPNGILFAFKKPLSFFPFSAIDSISYTSVLQRTFNLVIAARESSESEEVKEVEFTMLDQADFAGIDEYVKRHGLNDASMAAERRAKVHNVNKEKKEEGENGVNGGAEVGEDGLTELQRAEQQLQDAEEEEEEDYEASGGESDGEGGESEEDAEGYEGGEGGESEEEDLDEEEEGAEE